MSVGIGIIGLAESGRTTIFNALTKGNADTGVQAQKALHIGIAKVPEPRLYKLAEITKPKKIVPAEVKYLDIGASLKGMDKDSAISGEHLSHISNTDALINVVRAYPDESIPHPEGSIDVERDMATMNLELAYSDLAIIERRLNRIETSLKSAKADERHSLNNEQEFLGRIKSTLEKDIPIREQNLTEEENRLISGYQFLSAKPLLTVVNIGEDKLSRMEIIEDELNQRFLRPHQHIIALCGKLEMELAQLDDTSTESFRTEFGLTEAGLERTIRLSYKLLSLITFFTTASEEVKAWSVRQGTSAPRAAGKIHSDMERGFIRAEVITYDDLMKCGSIAEGRKRGLLRLEGKNYIIQDGDVINFLFNV
ncbi:MAG TPA: redox-regulated ATPase YchF [Dehalococcoidia bacterium]|nr:redox-regulated ATPase YchF [Dehalococcoidia bacterium]